VTTAERALRVLIHDLRTPVGVAQGYLRLIQQDRLGAGEARERAFRQVQAALESIAKLADDAARLLDGPASGQGTGVAVSSQQLVDRVCARLPTSTVQIAVTTQPAGTVAVQPDVDGLADAIADVLLSAGPAARNSVTVGSTGSEIWFAAGTVGDPGGEPLDPWRTPGLALPVACLTVGQSGGRLWSVPGGAGGVGVAFPLETAR
jgi:signal transduction histidine kinase